MSTPTAIRPQRASGLTTQRALVMAIGLLALLGLLLILAPAERQLGNLVKIIYLHGALARTGMLGLVVAGMLGLAYLVRPKPALIRWSNATQIAGLAFFLLHFALSVIPTHETWGVWIAFDEPRTVMSLQIMGVSIVVILVRYLLKDDRFSAWANLLLAGAVALLSARTGVLRHPLNPIGDSTSTSIQLFYGGILVTCLALMVLLAWWMARGGGEGLNVGTLER